MIPADLDGEGGQTRVVDFLAGGGLGESVERIDTHGAVVFLGSERAWKMKRALRFSFMDLSTLAARERIIRAELRLNRRTAPELYRKVLPVTRSDDGSIALEGSGEPVEWLLEMRHFPADAELDRVRRQLKQDLGLAAGRDHHATWIRCSCNRTGTRSGRRAGPRWRAGCTGLAGARGRDAKRRGERWPRAAGQGRPRVLIAAGYPASAPPATRPSQGLWCSPSLPLHSHVAFQFLNY